MVSLLWKNWGPTLMPDPTRLAGATKPCPLGCKKGGHDAVVRVCDVCGNTGRVPLFPDESGVRVACSAIIRGGNYSTEAESSIVIYPKARHPTPCGYCNSRGWTPATEGWAEQCDGVSAYYISNSKEWCGEVRFGNQLLFIDVGDGCPTFAALVILGLTRAVEAHEGWTLYDPQD